MLTGKNSSNWRRHIFCHALGPSPGGRAACRPALPDPCSFIASISSLRIPGKTGEARIGSPRLSSRGVPSRHPATEEQPRDSRCCVHGLLCPTLLNIPVRPNKLPTT